MKNKSSQKRKEFTGEEIKSFFEEVNRAGRLLYPALPPKHKDQTFDWITTSGSSKQSNKLVKVSKWQIG